MHWYQRQSTCGRASFHHIWTLYNPLSIWTLSISNSLLIWHLFDPISIQLHGIDPLLSPSHANGVGIFALCVLSSHQKLCALDHFNRAMEPELSKTCIFALTWIFAQNKNARWVDIWLWVLITGNSDPGQLPTMMRGIAVTALLEQNPTIKTELVWCNLVLTIQFFSRIRTNQCAWSKRICPKFYLHYAKAS